ncbi:MAG: helix-turn-helix domain-containing protein, partial [Deltaproteobacteria bacterium]|nr:helix-turn-helix domain-containing protein [Deltaproteobacteria bacterium]
MQTAGDYLKKCREAQNMSLSDIAETTKITKIYLEYLENNEYENITAKPYVKGYIS